MAYLQVLSQKSFAGAHIGFSEGRTPNFRKRASQYKANKKQIQVIYW